jgi:hypothetical protein
MPTIKEQLISKCEEARDTYPEGHAQRVKIEAQIEKLKAGTGCNPRGFNPGG